MQSDDIKTVLTEGATRLASGLAACALLSVEDEGQAIARIEPFLNTLYRLSPSMQSDIATHALDMLADYPGASAEGWLLDELEFQAQGRSVERAGRQADAYAFAIPVLLTGDSIPCQLRASEVSEIEQALLDGEVVEPSARVDLSTGLYTLEQLLGFAWGEVAALCEAAQSCDELPPGAWAPAAFAGTDEHPLRLRFLLGVATVEGVAAEDVFPSIEPKADEDELASFMPQGLDEIVGVRTPRVWEEEFTQALERACGHEVQAVSISAPEGFYYDLVTGMREWRSAVLKTGLDAQLERLDLDADDLCYEVQPGVVPEGGAYPFLVNLHRKDDDFHTLTLEWFSLPEEPVEVAFEELEELLEELNLEPKLKYAVRGIFLLH